MIPSRPVTSFLDFGLLSVVDEVRWQRDMFADAIRSSGRCRELPNWKISEMALSLEGAFLRAAGEGKSFEDAMAAALALLSVEN